MKIVVLDAYAMNPGDLSWEGLRALGDCVIYDRTPPGKVAARAQGAEMVLTNKVVLNAPVLAALPVLRYLGVLATGTNVVDLAAAHARGIVVTNVPDYSTPSVAQLTLALLLELANGAGRHAASVRAGAWSRSPDFCFWETPQVELHGLNLGLVGWGRIGRAVATVGQAFGMRLLVHTPRPPAQPPAEIEFIELDSLFSRADVVSLHCPLTAETRGLVNRERLARMKPTAFLLNTGRGPLVDEAALAEALNQGRIAGAGLDVLTSEPPPLDNPLLIAQNCVITPHLAWGTRAARQRLMDTVVANARAFLAGQPQNVVN